MEMHLIKKNLPIIILTIISILMHFLFLSYPREVVFDEVWFGRYAAAYFTHQYYFDLHPPLGKLLIAGFAKLAGFQGGFDFDHIGETFNTGYIVMMRFLPALLGSLIPLLIYLLLKKMGGSKKAAFFGAFLTVFDNALLTQSKFILLDIFILFFGFSALYFYLICRDKNNDKKSLFFLVTSAILAAFALSIKWTGLSFLGLIGLLFLIDSFNEFWPNKKIFNFKAFFLKLFILILIPLIVYYIIFWIHFQLLYKSGPGDAFMSSQFQGTLIGSNITQNETAPSQWQKFIELNKAMYVYNSGLTASHPDASKWYQWPIDQKPIWYWSKSENGKVGNIYLFGNPIIWWSVLVGIIFSLFAISIKKIRQKLPPIFYILLLGYFGNILPYIFIKRIAFLYHYLPSLVFGILILSILYEKVFEPFLLKTTSQKTELFFYFGFLSLCFITFLILSPISYGFLISPKLNEFYSFFIKFLH